MSRLHVRTGNPRTSKISGTGILLLAVPGRTEGVLLEACILDGQLFCLHSRRYDQGYGGTVHPETGTKINAGICAAGIHPRSCGVSYGRGTLLNLIELKDKVLSWPRRSQPSLKRSPGKVGNESREAEAPASKH